MPFNILKKKPKKKSEPESPEDMAIDKKMGIKPGSKQDLAMDNKKGK